MAIPIIPIAEVVKILGPKAVRAAKAIHKNMEAKAKREGSDFKNQM